jgi:hypothetical protein
LVSLLKAFEEPYWAITGTRRVAASEKKEIVVISTSRST